MFMCTDPLATTAASRLATEEPSKGCSCATVWLRNLVRSITWKLLLWRDLLVVPLSCEPLSLSLSLSMRRRPATGSGDLKQFTLTPLVTVALNLAA